MPGSSRDLTAFTRHVLLLALLVGVVFLLTTLTAVPLVLFGGVLLGVFFRNLAEPLGRVTRIGTLAALPVVVLAIIAALALVGTLFGTQLAAQLDELMRQLPAAVGELVEEFEQTTLGAYLKERSNDVTPEDMLGGMPARIALFATGLFGAIVNLVLTLAIGLYLAADPTTYRDGTIRLVPPTYRARAGEVMTALDQALWRWLVGQFIAMLFVGVITTIGLTLLGIPMALALGLLAGLFEFVPIIGPIIAAVPAVLVGFTQGGWTALYVALLYFGVQQFESYVIVPIIQRYAVSLPPVLSLIAVVIFGLLFGFGGMILAAPLMVTVMVLVRMLYIEDTLESDRASALGSEERSA